MKQWMHLLAFFAVIVCFLSSSIAMAQPAPSPVLSDHAVKPGKKLKMVDPKDKKALERDVAKHKMNEMAKTGAKPIQDPPPHMTGHPEDRPPKIVPDKKIRKNPDLNKPLHDGKMQKIKLKKELSPVQKECRIDREACRQDCKAAQKVCGKGPDCGSHKKSCGVEFCTMEFNLCKKNCKKTFACR